MMIEYTVIDTLEINYSNLDYSMVLKLLLLNYETEINL